MNDFRKIMILINIMLILIAMIFLIATISMENSPTGMVVMGLNGEVTGKGKVGINLDTGEGVSFWDITILIPLALLISAIAFLIFIFGINLYKGGKKGNQDS